MVQFHDFYSESHGYSIKHTASQRLTNVFNAIARIKLSWRGNQNAHMKIQVTKDKPHIFSLGLNLLSYTTMEKL